MKSFQNHLQNIRNEETATTVPDLEVMNECFANIGSTLSYKTSEIQAQADTDRLEKTVVVYQTNASEVNKVVRKMKCKKIIMKMASPMK